MKKLCHFFYLITFCSISFICDAGNTSVAYRQVGFRSDTYHQNQWVPSDSSQPSDYTYDSLGRLIKQYVRQWNGFEWAPSYYVVRNYSQSGIMTFYRYNWNIQTQSYQNANYILYVYNGLNQLSSDTGYIWNDSTQLWQYSKYYTYLYNDSALEILQSIYSWIDTSNSWLLTYTRSWIYNHGKQYETENYQPPYNGEKWFYGFDYAGRVIADTTAIYNYHNQTWSYQALKVYRYDINGNLAYKLFYAYDTTSNSFYITQFDSSVYDNHNYLVEDYLGTIASGEHINTKDVYTNDSNGNNLLEIEYLWDSTSQSWVNNNKIESTYDTKGNQLLYITYTWNKTNHVWQGYFKDSMQYNSHNQWILMIYQYWDSTYWKNNSYNELQIEYSDSGKIIMQTQNLYNWWDSVWIINYRGIYQFDDYGNEIFRMSENGGFPDTMFLSGVKFYYYYEALDISNNDPIMPKPLTIYPDPASQTLNIALSQTYMNEHYFIYNLLGQRMATGFLTANNFSIDVSGYADGLYILSVNGINHKFVVRK